MLLFFALGVAAQYSGGPSNNQGAGQSAFGYGADEFNGNGNGGQVAQNTQQDFRWNLYQADRSVRASELDARGQNLFYNLPLNLITSDPRINPTNKGLLRFGGFTKAAGNQLDEERLQDQIDYYRSTHPQMTQADRNVVDDLVLQRESARNQKLRRTLEALPFSRTIPGTGGYLPAFFERRSNFDDLQLAQNALYDSRKDVRQNPTQDKLVQFRNARDDVSQADDRGDANTLDLLGNSFGGVKAFAPVLRKKASQTKLDIGYRNLRLAQQVYAKEPTEINRLNVKLANMFIDNTSQEDDANKNDIVTTGLFGVSAKTNMLNLILSAKNFQDESAGWLQYDRLKRKILIKQHIADAQKAGASGDQNTVAQQMLGMSMYGPPAGGNPQNGPR